MAEPQEKQEDARPWVMTERHYKAVSQWWERLGLVVVASLVIQKVVAGASLADPVVIFGIILTTIIYAAAYILLLRS